MYSLLDLCEPPRVLVSRFCGPYTCGMLHPSGSSSTCPPSFAGCLGISLIFAVRHCNCSRHARWNLSGLSDDDYTRFWTQHLLVKQKRQTVGQQFCVWLCVQIPPIEALPMYKGWKVLCPPLLAIFIIVTLVCSMEFSLC